MARWRRSELLFAVAGRQRFLYAGSRLPARRLVQRAREALNIASERVRQKYGFACSAAMDQLAQIERDAERFREQAGATVKVIELS